jgi:hypothetical protein
MKYKCFNCSKELSVHGNVLRCNNPSCMCTYPKNGYDDPAVIVVENCWTCPYSSNRGSNTCTKTGSEFGAITGCGPLKDCPLKRVSQINSVSEW